MKATTRDKWRRVWQCVLSEVFPDRYTCIFCNKELQEPNRLGVCDACGPTLPYVGRSFCLKCGKPILPEGADAPLPCTYDEELDYLSSADDGTDLVNTYCAMCRHNPRHFDRVRSVFSYQGEVRRALYRLKFGHAQYMAPYLAAYLADTYLADPVAVDLVVAVPMHAVRRRRRGYNQSHLIARSFAERLRLSYSRTAVRKTRATDAQTHLSMADRQTNLKGAFAVDSAEVAGKSVLVIDDILTTGATLSEVADALKQAGAVHVYGLTVANVPEH